MIRNGEWGQRREGGGASEDPAQAADADGSRAEGTMTQTLAYSPLTCVYRLVLYADI